MNRFRHQCEGTPIHGAKGSALTQGLLPDGASMHPECFSGQGTKDVAKRLKRCLQRQQRVTE